MLIGMHIFDWKTAAATAAIAIVMRGNARKNTHQFLLIIFSVGINLFRAEFIWWAGWLTSSDIRSDTNDALQLIRCIMSSIMLPNQYEWPLSIFDFNNKPFSSKTRNFFNRKWHTSAFLSIFVPHMWCNSNEWKWFTYKIIY